MNPFRNTRVTQVAALLLLSAYWLTSAQPASASAIPAPDSDAASTATPAVTEPATVVIHGHTSLWVYAGVAVLAVVVTLVAVGLARWARQVGSARQKALTA